MEAFLIGWCVSAFWGIFIAPIIILKTSFRLPLDD